MGFIFTRFLFFENTQKPYPVTLWWKFHGISTVVHPKQQMKGFEWLRRFPGFPKVNHKPSVRISQFPKPPVFSQAIIFVIKISPSQIWSTNKYIPNCYS